MQLLLNSAEVCRKPQRSLARPTVMALAVALGHAVLLAWLAAHWAVRPPAPAVMPEPVIAWLVARPPPQPPPPPAPPPPPVVAGTQATAPRPAVAPTAARQASRTAPVPSVSPGLPDPAAPAPVAVAEPPPPPASAPRLLDTDATRRAIRDLARAPLNVERHAIDPIASTAEREAERIREAAKGDCSEGQYAGAGAGLLSVPFYLAAHARGACAR